MPGTTIGAYRSPCCSSPGFGTTFFDRIQGSHRYGPSGSPEGTEGKRCLVFQAESVQLAIPMVLGFSSFSEPGSHPGGRSQSASDYQSD
jgi:hypothetical protein